jgi:hypothetical protein
LTATVRFVARGKYLGLLNRGPPFGLQEGATVEWTTGGNVRGLPIIPIGSELQFGFGLRATPIDSEALPPGNPGRSVARCSRAA